MTLTFEDAIAIAKGCFDYGGGYRANNDRLAIESVASDRKRARCGVPTELERYRQWLKGNDSD